MAHRWLGPDQVTTECPMRAWQDREAMAGVELHALWKRLGALPRAGGLNDQEARDVSVIALCERAAVSRDQFAQRLMMAERRPGA